MAKRAKLTALLGAMLAGFLVLVGGAAPASAHAGHNHSRNATAQAPAPVVVDHEAIGATVPDEIGATVPDETESPPGETGSQNDLTTTPAKIPAPVHQGNCCCGSIACHAGVEPPAAAAIKDVRVSARVEPVPVSGTAKFNPHGIDRPPRSLPL
jgi:hypothetical protein